MNNKIRFSQVVEFGKTAGNVIGTGIEIPGQLGNLCECPGKGLLRVRSRSGRPYYFAFLRKGARIIGQGANGRNSCIKRKIRKKQFNAYLSVSSYHFLDKRIRRCIRVYGRCF